MNGLTIQAAEFVAGLKRDMIPEVALNAAAMGITDAVGVMIAGAEEEAPRLVATLVTPSAAADAAPAIPSGTFYAPADAALVNGVAAHVLDFDDVGIDGHPSTVLAPAILAEGWSLGSRGDDALAAYVAGYEIWALMHELEPGQMHDRGFHPTAVKGTVAVAAACARLRGLSAEQTGHAIATAASLASGLVANFGTMTKSLHAGRTAQSGIVAARLASIGFTASLDVLEHPTGFMRAHSPSGEPDLAARDHRLGVDWRMPTLGINIKRYPLCYSTHRAIDAMLDIVEEHDLAPEAVKEIRVGSGSTQLLMLRNHDPKTGLEAKFSMEFAMASALVARRVGVAELSDAFVRQADVVEAMKKVSTTAIHHGIVGLSTAEADTVEVELVSGAVLTHEPVAAPRGSWAKPLEPADMRAKFMDCIEGRIDPRRAASLFETLMDLGSVKDLRDLPLGAETASPLRRTA